MSNKENLGLRPKRAPVKFFDEIACRDAFTRFLFSVALLALGLAVEFILNGWDRILDGGESTSGGVATGGGIESGNGR